MFVRPEDWRPQGVGDLEPRAWDALRETNRSVCVTAGAGAGKTEFLAQKAAYLLQTGICPAPKRILAISFKRDAAQNLAARVRKRCSAEQARRLQSMTFDAFTKGIMDRFRMAVPDNYRPPADYTIVFPARRDFDDVLERHGRRDFAAQDFERALSRVSLPIQEANIDQRDRDLLEAYWQEQLTSPQGAMLSFSMINRLVDYIIRSHDGIRLSLRLTFPFVFLDEFQDTTYAQYQLVQSAFGQGGPVFTAVGDDKQRIMGWAGAMANAFDQFTADFGAVRHALLSNYRSHADLVGVQHVIAQRIDPNVEAVQAHGQRNVDGDTSAIWRFADRNQESRQIAAWIRHSVDVEHVAPHDISLLVRMRANDVEDELAPIFAEQGLSVRNLARNVGGIAIQDLLVEPLSRLLIPFLRLGATERNPEAWSIAQINIGEVAGIDLDDEVAQERLLQETGEFCRRLRHVMAGRGPDFQAADAILQDVLNFVQVERLRRAFPEYRRDADFERVLEGFQVLLRECSEGAVSWAEVLDRFEGVGQVPLMTIHKSKGLEFHTIIFLGLDDRSWWSLNPNNAEELNSFFVAFTRAMQRAFFTCCAQRGGAINWLEEFLVPAGVAELDGANILPNG